MIVCNELSRELDGPGATDTLSSYAIRFSKENFVGFQVEHDSRMTQRCREYKIFATTDLLEIAQNFVCLKNK